MYKRLPEPTSIPPAWFAWLHFLADEPLAGKAFSWQRSPMPNLTGTALAHKPRNPQASKRYYTPWEPK